MSQILQAAIGFVVKFLVEWLRDWRRDRDLERLGWQDANLDVLRKANNARSRMDLVVHRSATERLRQKEF